MFKKALKAIWKGIDFSRKLILNLVFLLIVIVLVISIFSSEDEVKIAENSVLRLDLNGTLVEQKRYVDPIDAAINDSMGTSDLPVEILVDDVIDVIDSAAEDKRIAVMLLDLQKLHRAHLNKLKAVADAIDRFKQSGKKVIATGYYYTQTQYYLAAHADEVNLHPYGGVSIEGYGMFPLYFKDALEKLSVSQHIFRVGTYKSAVEPLIRNNMSDAAKQANQLWLDGLWQQYKQDVAAQRPFDESNFDEDLGRFLDKFKDSEGDSGQFALKHGWVDALKSNQQIHDEMVALVGTNGDGKKFKQVNFRDYLSTIKMPAQFTNPLSEKVAVVVAKGTIVDGKRKAGEIGGDSTAALLRKARLNDKVKAVVLRVDSGGGSMFASEVIRAEVLALKAAGKPVVASMSSVAASGGYWISSAANEIWAAPSTITGSIGVFGAMMTFENSLARLGVYSDGVATTDMAGFSPARALDEKLAQVIQTSVENAYHKFLTVVAEARGMTPEEVDKIAQGRVWIATKAKELGLVDHLGNKHDAIDAAAKLAGLAHYDVITVEQELSPKEQFIHNLFGSDQVQSLFAATDTQRVMGLQAGSDYLLKQLKAEIKGLNDYNDPNALYARCLVCTLSN